MSPDPRAEFTEIRLAFRPQPNRLRTDPVLKSGFPFSSIHFKRAGFVGPAGKPVLMPIDLDPYRRIAATHGEAHLYTDAALLRLYAVLQDVVPRKAREVCPHLFADETAEVSTATAAFALPCEQTPNKEASP